MQAREVQGSVAAQARSRLRLILPMNVRRVVFIFNIKMVIETRTNLLDYRFIIAKVPLLGYRVPYASVKSAIIVMRGIIAVPSVIE